MCVHRTQEKAMELHVSVRKKKVKRVLLQLLKESSIVVTVWMILSCATQMAHAAPFLKNSGGNAGEMRIDKEMDDAPQQKNSGFAGGFISSFSMIVVSELGDKTFFIGLNFEVFIE
jgi:putative Ca2+/H+ antiporter (TMEM165/GDT1 family)